MKSRLGKIFSLTYLAIVLVGIIYIKVCSATFCGLGFIYLMLPWMALLKPSNLDFNIYVLLSVIFNTIILYFIGFVGEWFYKRIFKK